MKELFIKELICKTKNFLDDNQRIKLEEILTNLLSKYTITKINNENEILQVLKDNEQILNHFCLQKKLKDVRKIERYLF